MRNLDFWGKIIKRNKISIELKDDLSSEKSGAFWGNVKNLQKPNIEYKVIACSLVLG